MEISKIALFLAIFAAIAANAVFSTTAISEPILQITSSTTVPSEVYPGTLGYAQLTLTNAGSATAKSVTAYYYIDNVRQSISTSDIVAGSDSQISVPFKIRESSAGGIELVAIDIFYSFDSTSGVSSKKTSVSIPLRVSRAEPLEITTDSIEPPSIAPGEKLVINFSIKNNDGVMNGVTISMPSSSNFSLDGASSKNVGILESNSTRAFSITVVSSTTAEKGVYGLPITVTYQDALNVPIVDTYSVGPISVREVTSQYRLYLVPQGKVEIGSQTKFDLILENSGSSTISAVVDINSTSVFMPIGVQRVYFDSIPPKGRMSKEITIGVSSTSAAGFYSIPLYLTPSAGQASTVSAGVVVAATPQITLYYDSSQSSPQIQIANTGNSQIRSVYVSVKPSGSTIDGTENFVGTLNVDDYSTVSATSMGVATSYDVTVRYRDSVNQEKTFTQTVNATSGSYARFGVNTTSGGRQGLGNNSRNGNFGGSPLGFILGPGGQSSNSANNLPLLLGGAAIIVVAVFLAYRKFFGKKAVSK